MKLAYQSAVDIKTICLSLADRTPEILLSIGSLLHLALAIGHVLFWRLFRWKEDLVSLSPLNRAAIQILNLSHIFGFAAIAYISFYYQKELLATNLGSAIRAAISLFWLFRMLQQLIYFRSFRRSVSIAFILLFILMSLVYWMTFTTTATIARI